MSSLELSLARLRDGKLATTLRVQSTVLKAIHDFMTSKGFVQLMPIITSRVTDPLWPDPGASIIGRPKINYNGQELVLTQSMILHKQLALITGLERIYIMSPNIRFEKPARGATGRHLFEFTQMDFEMAHATMKDVMSLVEDLVIYTLKRVREERKEELELLGREVRIPSKPFKVYTTHEMEEKYGSDWEIKASMDHKEPFWVTCFKREFYDREDPDNPGHYRNYDLIYPEGYGEALSGGEREWEYERIIARMKRDGLNPENFKEYIEAAKRGLLVPSAGAGLGVERFVRYIVGAKHIGDIQPFRRVPGEPVYL